MLRNVISQKWRVYAWDVTTGLAKTGEAANITGKINKDDAGATSTNDTNPTEADSTNEKGYYDFDLTQAESNAAKVSLSPKCSTSNINVMACPPVVYTVPQYASLLVIDSAGLADANAVKGGPTGAGVAVNANTITHLNQIYDTDYATIYDTTNKAFLAKLGNFAMGGSSLALTTGAIAGTTLTLSGAVAFQSTFAVTGTVTYNAFSVTNALTVSGTTTLTGAVSAGAAFTITGNFTAANLTNARIGYLDNLNVGGPVASHADILSVNQSASKHVLLQTVGQYERPESGNTIYTVEARTFAAADGAAVNADTTPTLTATGQTSGSLAANLSAAANPATGVYRWTYTVSSSATIEPIRFDVSAAINSSTFTLSCYSQVVDEVSATWTSTDATHLTAIYNKLPTNNLADETLVLAAVAGVKSDTNSLVQSGVNVTAWNGSGFVTNFDGVPIVDVGYLVGNPTGAAAPGYFPADVRKHTGVQWDFFLEISPARAVPFVSMRRAQDGAIASATFAAGATVPRVTLVDTTTTYTGNTPQTGDTYALANGASGFAAIKTDTGNLVTRITSTLFTGITSLAQWLGLMAGKQTGNTTARTEVRATGAGAGTFLETDDSLEAIADNAGGGGGGGIVTGYATGMSPEILVLDALAADHDIAGTIGQKINAAGGAADPLLNDVPGAYASGTAGAALGRLGTGEITTVSPVSLNGDVEIVRGDSYLATDASALEWTNADGTWPDLTGATILFEAARGRYTAAGSVVTPTGTQKVRVELTAAQSEAFKIGLADSAAFDFFIRATLSNSHVRTLVRGRVTVLNPEDSL